MKRIVLTLLITFLTAVAASVGCAAAETAGQLLTRASRKIMSSGSVTASFSYSAAGSRGSGTLKVSGRKFTVQTPGSSSWYDGKNMWTYNAASRETTLVNPTASELAETNPLLYLATANAYNCAYGKGNSATKKIIILTPKSRKQPVRSATLELDGKTLNPMKISVISSDGSSSTVSITRYTLGKALPASNFIYPKNKYPKIKIIDLR